MTIQTKVICDSCEKEIIGIDERISIIVADGYYEHVHVRCLEKNLSNWLTSTADPKERQRVINILLGRKENY